LARITLFRNIHPPLVYPKFWPYHFIRKGIFEEVIFLLKYHQNPQETEYRKKKREKEKIEEEKKKLQESLQIKGKSIFYVDKNTTTSKSSFWCDSIFSPSIIPFQKPLPKSLRMFS
jgi:hypothetical protein